MKRKQPQGRPKSIVQPKHQKIWGAHFLLNLEKIGQKYDTTRPENLLSEKCDVSVYAVRQWAKRGIPLRFSEFFASICGISVKTLMEQQGRG